MIEPYQGCTHFRCVGCDKIKKIGELRERKVAYAVFDSDSQDKYFFILYWVHLCPKCDEGINKEEKKYVCDSWNPRCP